jgi:hypothetical protein
VIFSLSVIAVFGIIVFLSGGMFGVFVLLIISRHRTARSPRSGPHGEQAGAISRRILVRARADGREISS